MLLTSSDLWTTFTLALLRARPCVNKGIGCLKGRNRLTCSCDCATFLCLHHLLMDRRMHVISTLQLPVLYGFCFWTCHATFYCGHLDLMELELVSLKCDCVFTVAIPSLERKLAHHIGCAASTLHLRATICHLLSAPPKLLLKLGSFKGSFAFLYLIYHIFSPPLMFCKSL